MTETALERLSNITDKISLQNWWYKTKGCEPLLSDIQEVVALAKANQQPSIDAMRFEAAKAAMSGILAGLVTSESFSTNDVIENSLYYADALMQELQKPKL